MCNRCNCGCGSSRNGGFDRGRCGCNNNYNNYDNFNDYDPFCEVERIARQVERRRNHENRCAREFIRCMHRDCNCNNW